MWTKLTVIGCFLLTVMVVHTALRIEHLNALSGILLPRSTPVSNAQWRVHELQSILNYVDTQIAKRRSQAFAVEHPGEATPAEQTFTGAPYTTKEQNWIDRSKNDHASHTKLRWWVVHLGGIQYLLAPLAFVWAMGNVLALRNTTLRLTSGLCALLSFGAIFLMIFRGY